MFLHQQYLQAKITKQAVTENVLKDYESMKMPELRKLAKQLNVQDMSKLRKQDLIAAIIAAQ